MLGDGEHLIRLNSFVAGCEGFILPLMSLAEHKLSQYLNIFKAFFLQINCSEINMVYSNKHTRRNLVSFFSFQEINRR